MGILTSESTGTGLYSQSKGKKKIRNLDLLKEL